MIKRKVYSINDISNVLGVSVSYCYRLVRSGKLKAIGSSPVMVTREHLQAYCLSKMPCISTLFLGR